jgi:fatty-acyl-CoA synthase
MAKRAGFDEEDRVLSAMPMFHVGGSVCALLGAITVGYRLCTGSSFDAGETLRLIEEEKITAYAGLEPMYLAIRNHEDFQRRSRASLKKGWTAGTPAILRMVAEEIGIRNICSLYGLSEGSPNVCITHWQNDPYEKRIGTMGRPQPGTEVKVADPVTSEPPALYPSQDCGCGGCGCAR